MDSEKVKYWEGEFQWVGLMLLENSFVLFCWVVAFGVFFLGKILKSVHKCLGKKHPIRHTLGMNPMKTY